MSGEISSTLSREVCFGIYHSLLGTLRVLPKQLQTFLQVCPTISVRGFIHVDPFIVLALLKIMTHIPDSDPECPLWRLSSLCSLCSGFRSLLSLDKSLNFFLKILHRFSFFPLGTLCKPQFPQVSCEPQQVLSAANLLQHKQHPVPLKVLLDSRTSTLCASDAIMH